MITITVVENKPVASPKGRLAALKARQTMAAKAGKADVAADYGSEIRKIEDEHPELKAVAKPTTSPRPVKAKAAREGSGDPRRRLGALRALRQRHVNSGEAERVAEYDQRIKAFIAEHPGVEAPRTKPRAETKTDDGEVDRAAVLAVQAQHTDVITAQIDRILRRSKERRQAKIEKKPPAKSKTKPAPLKKAA